MVEWWLTGDLSSTHLLHVHHSVYRLSAIIRFPSLHPSYAIPCHQMFSLRLLPVFRRCLKTLLFQKWIFRKFRAHISFTVLWKWFSFDADLFVEKPPKWGFVGGKWYLIRKFCNCASMEFTETPIHVWFFTFSGSGWNNVPLLFWQEKFTLCAHLAEGVKSLKGSLPDEPTCPCRISSPLVLVCWS